MMKNVLSVLIMSCFLGAFAPANAEEYNAIGDVEFSNLQALLGDIQEAPFSAIVPLKGKQFSDFNGRGLQTGAIIANSPVVPATQEDLDTLEEGLQEIGQSIDFDSYLTLTFTGVQAPNPRFGNRPLQVIVGRGGQVHTTWEARFYIFIDPSTGEAILCGDGAFTVVGGTGQNRNATGAFRTIFITVPTELTADESTATYWQFGEINR
jgi:hypothetical protein